MGTALARVGREEFEQNARIARQARHISMSENAKWYCAITNPNCQRRAEMELYSLGYRTFTPKIRRWATHARVRKAVERAILGRYLFVAVDDSFQSFHEVRMVNGVEGFVSMLGWPSPMNADEIESLRLRQMAGEWDEIVNGPIPVGARVRIMQGQFEDMLATVLGVSSRGRVSFKILDTNTHGEIKQSQVRAA